MTDESSVLDPKISLENKVHKASPPIPSSSALSPITSNARSCVTCRKRKVKCDKKHPCNHCTRQGIECIYPPPGRAPRKPRKPQDAALVERLRRLEAVVQTLGAQVSPGDEVSVSPKDGEGEVMESTEAAVISTDEKIRKLKKEFKELVGAKREQHRNEGNDVDGLTERFGTLLLKQGRSRYINPGFWSMFNAEVEDLKGQVLELSDEEEEDYSTPASHTTSSTQGFLFGLSSTNVQMSLLRPQSHHIMTYWETYCENVEPLLRMLHRPTREPQVLSWIADIDSISKDSECILFAICYAAVTSLWPDDCWQKFGESKSDLLARYRFGLEQALARADFLQTDSIFVLQSFIIFLTCLRRSSDTRLVWSLSALAVRISQGLGLHRDGSHYPNVPIFKQEYRRIIWWHTIVLDSRVCEDLGSDAAINGRMWDTKLPRNLNDTDIDFNMTELPESRLGCTDMTFNLIRFEIGAGFSKILRGQHKHMMCQKSGAFSQEGLEKRRQVIVDLQNRIEEIYLKDADLSVPINWVTATVTRMMLSKMWLMLYQPFQRKDGGRSLPTETRDELFAKALENVESAIIFRTEAQSPKFKRYSWLLQTYTQWHAIAFLLSELCVRTSGPEVEKAWTAVDFSMEVSWKDGSAPIDKPDAHLWKPLKLLAEKARAQRNKALEAEALKAKADMLNEIHEQSSDKTKHASVLMDLYPVDEPLTAPIIEPSTMITYQTWQDGMQPIDSTGFINSSTDLSITNGLSQASTYPLQTSDSHQIQMPDVSTSWSGQSTGIAPLPVDTTEIMADTSMNWATWDDMVEQWGVQNENQVNGNGLGPSFFGGGSNWF